MDEPSPPDSPARTPLSDRLCDLACLGFALWTVCAHLVVLRGGSLRELVIFFAVAAVVCTALARWMRAGAERGDGATEPAVEPRARGLAGKARLAGWALGLGVVAGTFQPGRPVTVWWAVVLLLGAAAVGFVLLESPRNEVGAALARTDRRAELGLWLLALACAGVALVVHRPDLDDSFYVNVAVDAADHPDAALLAGDMLHGVPGLPLHMPAHRVHTWELFNGAVSWLTGIPAIRVFHWWTASLAAVLLVLAHARLFKKLRPRHWLWATAVLVAVLLAAGETHRWFANFALVRIWQGKALFLFVFVPLAYRYGLDYGTAPRTTLGRGWLLLAAAQVAAVGCSSSAIWAAPAAALIALAASVPMTAAGLGRLLVGATASVYTLGVGLLLKQDLAGLIAPMIETLPRGARLHEALLLVLGGSRLYAFGLGSILIAWACCRRGLARRFAIVAPLAVFVVLLSPFWDRLVAGNVTGPSFWRAMWALPVPILMTFVLLAPLELDGTPARRAAGRAASVLAVVLFAWLVPAFSAFSPRNEGGLEVPMHVGRPALKVPPLEYRWAEWIAESVPPGSAVAAPPDVSVWLPTIQHHPFPLEVRGLYLQRYKFALGASNYSMRRSITRYLNGGPPGLNSSGALQLGIREFGLRAVCLRHSPRDEEIATTLRAAGFERVREGRVYELWVRG